MIFTQVNTDEDYDVVKFQSKSKRWSLGLKAMMFGVRVRCGLTGEPVVVLDLCAGADREDQLELLRLVMMILMPEPETITGRELGDLFPECRVKPVMLDPCWGLLVKAATEALQRATA